MSLPSSENKVKSLPSDIEVGDVLYVSADYFSAETDENYLAMIEKILLDYKEPKIINIRLDSEKFYIAHSEVIKFIGLNDWIGQEKLHDFLVQCQA